MISYWKNTKKIHEDDGFVLITGWYDHKNKGNGGTKALGVHWENFPKSRRVLSPCVIPETTRNAILSGLLYHAVINNNVGQAESIIEAIRFFKV